MAPLPKRPERSAPIPNNPFESPDITAIKGPYWDMALGSGLEADGNGSMQTSGSTPSEPTAMLYGPNGFVGVGTGLQLGPNGELEQSGSGYIYCTPQYGNLPVTYPPYGCNTEVNTSGVTNFTEAWSNCDNIEVFPCVDCSSGTNFSYSWWDCNNLSSFPPLDTSQGTSFRYSWSYSKLSSFPRINTSKGINFNGTWAYSYYLTGEFPKLDFSEAQTFQNTWYSASYETDEPISFPEGIFESCTFNGLIFNSTWNECSLSQQSVDNIIVSIDNSQTLWGFLDMVDSGSMPSLPVVSNVSNLWDKGWVVFLNDGSTGLPDTNFNCSTLVNTEGIEYLPYAWANCGLSEFPTIDVSSCKVFFEAWRGNNFLEFPTLDVSSGINFGYSWYDCSNLTTFPSLNTSSGIVFSGAWANCSSLASFPLLDVSSGVRFEGSWSQCTGLTSFPPLDVSSGLTFQGAWYGCSGLTSFPLLDVSSGTDFNGAWWGCTNLTSFPAAIFDNCQATEFYYAWYNCALSQQSVDNILVSLDVSGQPDGRVNINGGTSAAPSIVGLAAKEALQAKGWTVLTN